MTDDTQTPDDVREADAEKVRSLTLDQYINGEATPEQKRIVTDRILAFLAEPDEPCINNGPRDTCWWDIDGDRFRVLVGSDDDECYVVNEFDNQDAAQALVTKINDSLNGAAFGTEGR